ncbi:MAG: ATP-binding protein [Nitrospira sp.]|nr:ATP-binding protein [bacterium]MBL7049360.1 ATP-binding protein [Nitrospira sp.]
MNDAIKLNQAFMDFTEASKSLETYYAKLSERVKFLTNELEIKNAKIAELEKHHKMNLRLIAMGEMAATIVHEVRSPLCSIELFATMLSNDLQGTAHSEMANGISTGIKSLNNILTNMLLFAKPKKPAMNNIKLAQVMDESIAILAPLMQTRNIIVEKFFKDITICGDAELLKQVFMNIVMNAVQSMSEGGVVKISINSDEEEGVVSIEDAGEGIALDNIESIFDPFFSTKESGTGLGLAIAYRIVQSHGGVIRAERNEVLGSTFSVCLPIKEISSDIKYDNALTVKE